MAPPETRYARNGDARIAYQVIGRGKFDLVVVQGLVSHLGLIWDDPDLSQFYKALAAFARVIVFDKRGTGLSDRDVAIPGMADRIDDTLAVMDAAGAARAAVFGISEGGKMSLMLAATRPERVRALALYGAFARSPTQEWPPGQVATRFNLIERAWGTGMLPQSVAPSRAGNETFRDRWVRFERESASPPVVAALLRMDHEADVTDILSAVRVPSLLIHRKDDQRIGVEYGRALAAQMPQARYVELPGGDHLPHIGDTGRIIALIREFLAVAPA